MVLEKYPLIKASFKMVGSIPRIAEWIKNRPDFPY